MSIESAREFIDKMKSDEEFRKRITEAEDATARMALVKAQGFEFTHEELNEACSEIGDNELDAIAGGYNVEAEAAMEILGCYQRMEWEI